MANDSAEKFICPGEAYPISRSVHVARLAKFYPACRECAHRTDVMSLSPRQQEQIAAFIDNPGPPSVYHDEGVRGVVPNNLSAARLERIVRAMALYLISLRQPENQSDLNRPMRIVLAGDSRNRSAELLHAACMALRWAGCAVVDLGAAATGQAVLAMRRAEADGGVVIGNTEGDRFSASISFFGRDGRPLSGGDCYGGELLAIRRLEASTRNRPTRHQGELRRDESPPDLLTTYGKMFHSLRPLSVAMECHSYPVLRDFVKLTRNTACRMVESQPEEGYDFRAVIDGNGERLELADERGKQIAPQKLTLFLATQLLTRSDSVTIVLEQDLSDRIGETLIDLGATVFACGLSRTDMHETMRANQADLGADSAGRYWYGEPVPHIDPIRTIGFLTQVLSRSSHSASHVLDTQVDA